MNHDFTALPHSSAVFSTNTELGITRYTHQCSSKYMERIAGPSFLCKFLVPPYICKIRNRICPPQTMLERLLVATESLTNGFTGFYFFQAGIGARTLTCQRTTSRSSSTRGTTTSLPSTPATPISTRPTLLMSPKGAGGCPPQIRLDESP